MLTMNYLSTTGGRVETMTLPKNALDGIERVLVVDDFMRNGGSARGLVELAREFEAEPVGVGVLIETAEPAEKRWTSTLPSPAWSGWMWRPGRSRPG